VRRSCREEEVQRRAAALFENGVEDIAE